jgi:hypothetical protein
VSGDYRRSRLDEKLHEWRLQLEAAQVGFDEAQRALEQNRIRGEIRSYAASYASRWLAYLGGLEIIDRKASVPEWLKELSQTAEYGSLLGKASSAVDAGDSLSDPPFDAMLEPLRPFENLPDFVGSGLGEYQSLLGDIAADLESCTEDATFFREYRSALASGDRDNALVEAMEWVGLKAGPGVADNKLQELFREPLEQAEAFVQSDNLLKSEWADLVHLYDQEIRGRAPFTADADDEPVSPENLTALFGGATGAVRRVREAAGQTPLSPTAETWLARAESLSQILFESDSDNLRALRLRLTLVGKSYDPPNLEKNTRLEEIRVYLGESGDFLWKEGEDETKRLSVELFGDEAADYSYVRGTLAKKKGLVMRTVGGNWKPGEVIESASTEGFCAPLKLIERGLAAEAQDSGKDLDLSYQLEIPQKKKSAVATVSFAVTGEQVAPLLELMRSGFDPPPPSASGS